MLTSFRRKPASGSVAKFPSFPPPNRHSGESRNPAALQCSRHSRPQTVIPAKAGIRQPCKVPVIPAPKPSFRRKPESGSVAMFPSFRRKPKSGSVAKFPSFRRKPESGSVAKFPSFRRPPASGSVAKFPSFRRKPASGSVAKFPSFPPPNRHSGESRNPGAAR